MKLTLVLAFCVALASARFSEFEEERRRTDDWRSGSGSCQVGSRKVRTFDNVKLSVSLSKCYTVLAKDCSSEPKFVVLMRKLGENSDLNEVKIITADKKVVLTASEDNNRIKITINNRQMPLEQDQDLTLRGYPTIRISKEGQQQVKVQILDENMQIRFDGYICDITSSEQTHNEKCGLCSQAQSEYEDKTDARRLLKKHVTSDCGSESEFEHDERRSGRQFDDVNEERKRESRSRFSDDIFEQSPDWHSEETHDQQQPRYFPDEIYTRSNKRDTDNFFGDEETNDYFGGKYESVERPVLKHKIVKRGDEICVSLVPIPQCSDSSYPEGQVQKRVPYHCFHNNDPRVRKYESKIRNGEPVPEIQRLTPSMTRTEVVPVKCNKKFY